MNSRFHKRPGRGMRQQQRRAAGLSHPRDWSQAGLEEVAAPPCDRGEDVKEAVHLLGLPLRMGRLQTADAYCLTVLETPSSQPRC